LIITPQTGTYQGHLLSDSRIYCVIFDARVV